MAVFRILCAFMVCGVAVAVEGFVPLFNGDDLSGWSGESRLWNVEDGVIVGSTVGKPIKQNTFLIADGEYKDFVLRVKVKLRNHNSGIQFRSEALPDHVLAGYQADIAEATYFGMLYEEKKRGFMPYWNELSDAERAAIPKLVKVGDWNEFEILCEGDHVRMTLNGTVTCDIRDPNGARSGRIGLQLHTGDAMEVRFKDIEIKELGEKN